MIKPTVGRRVWYWPSDYDRATVDSVGGRKVPMAQGDQSQACDAGIACVHGDRMVNLSVFDHNGVSHPRCSVRLLQGDEVPRPGEAYAQWMPYQAVKSKEQEAVLVIDSVQYADGTLATRPGPLPALSPAEQDIEAEIVAKGLTAPRITPADIEAAIAAEHYFTAGQALTALQHPVIDSLNQLTFCVLVLRNGFTVTGESACASPENFNVETGRKIARQNAVQKIWMLEGYLLKESLHKEAMIDRATIGECGAD